jgi:hypothetical protein
MTSEFTLAFKDPKDTIDYRLRRNREIIFVSYLLLLYRFCFFLVLLINYPLYNESVDGQRMYWNLIGIVIHILALLPLRFKYIKIFQVLHAPLVILSYHACALNSVEGVTESEGIIFS